MDLSIIILTFNAKEITVKMLDSLKISLEFIEKSIPGIKYEVLVVDNDSTDGIREIIKKEYLGWLKLIENENTGFAKGNNLGIKYISSDTNYVLFLNPDIILDKSTLSVMYEYIKNHPEVGIATCEVQLWTGGLDIDAHRGFPTPWRAFCYFAGLEKLLGRRFPKYFGGYHLLEETLSEEHEIDVCLGAFMIIPKIIGDKINWWPEDYFTNGEDVDFCYQIKTILGYKIMYVPETHIIHYKGATKGTKKQSESFTKSVSKETKNKQIQAGVEAMKIFYNKYYRKKYPFFINWIVDLGIYTLLLKRKFLMKE